MLDGWDLTGLERCGGRSSATSHAATSRSAYQMLARLALEVAPARAPHNYGCTWGCSGDGC